MIVVSDDFKTAMKQPVKEIQAFIDAGDFSIRDEDDLISFKISCESGLCKSAMRKLEAKYLGEHNLVGKWVTAGFGVKLASGAYDQLHYGSFLVMEQTVTKDTGITEIVAYDKMVNAMTKYEKFDIAYPVGLYAYTKALCEACNLELGNGSFPIHNDWQIERELWENIDGITYRDIFVQIAQATATTCIIHDDKVWFKSITATGERLTYDNMFKLKLEPMYGEINSVVLARTPQEDNVFKRDEESIAVYGLTEFKIENNEIVDKNREGAILPIYNELVTLSYYPFECTTEGLGWYEIGDHFCIVNDTGDEFYTTLFNYNITIDGGIKETLKAAAESKTQTQYQYATSIVKRLKNAEIIVNKQDNEIKSLVSDMYDEGGVVNQKYSQIVQDINGIVASVQNSGGSNLIKNSVMFAVDKDGNPLDWVTDGKGTLTRQSDTAALSSGGISGHSFTLLGKEVSQNVTVKVSTDADPITYSFSIRISKGIAGEAIVTLLNDFEEHEIWIKDGESTAYVEYEIKGLHPKQNYYKVIVSSSGGDGATFTDAMFAVGEYKSKWTQANGEVMNTQVCVSVDGITVQRDDGDYTVMSPQEFAGYTKVSGTAEKVFSLNKDVTEVKKLEAEDELKMPPIKIVPVTAGDIQGWAFVPTT
ncbi:MAG: hypothetical protein IKW46_07475 [Bacteroidaceae bacterium]|nr:hypothetical protein [Bacteroidaceae bacterium]